MRFACDTGGTFTDLIAEDRNGELRMYKAPTMPADPVAGVLDVVATAAMEFDESVARGKRRRAAQDRRRYRRRVAPPLGLLRAKRFRRRSCRALRHA